MTGVRWNQDEGWFEGKCDACGEYLPLDADTRHDLWPVTGRGCRVCRACDQLRTRTRLKSYRQDPLKRAAEVAANRAYRESLSPAERRAMRRSHKDIDAYRAYHAKWMRDHRARQRDAA